jgi:release factor glutamine methyltransferase
MWPRAIRTSSRATCASSRAARSPPGPQGLDDLAEIVAGAPARLVDGGWLFLEHGYDQAAAARGLLADAGFAAIASWADLAGIERVSGGRWLGRGQR